MSRIPQEERREQILAIHTARRVPSVLLLVHLTVRRGHRPQRVMHSFVKGKWRTQENKEKQTEAPSRC